MRAIKNAPVDVVGCDKLGETFQTPEVYRYQTLVALMLSSQTKDQATAAAMHRLKQHGLTIDNVLRMSEESMSDLIQTVSFNRRKADFILRTTAILSTKGDIPCTIEELLELPGVGPKMAYLCLEHAWGITAGIGVDTHAEQSRAEQS